MIIKKNTFCVTLICLLLLSIQRNTYGYEYPYHQPHYRIIYKTNLEHESKIRASLLFLSFVSFLTYLIYKHYKKNKNIITSIKNIMLENKAEIKKLFYNYPGIITFYKDIIIKENTIIAENENPYYQTNIAELMSIKKIFYSIIYEIIKILKKNVTFYDIEHKLIDDKKLLEDIIKEIILNDPYFIETIL